MADPAFARTMAQRWTALRKDVLSNPQINVRIDVFAAPLLSGPGERNFQRWRILDVKSPYTESPYITIATSSYPEQIRALQKFFRQRAAWMDAALMR